MALTYKHGVYSERDNVVLSANQSLSTIPAYIGTLPVQRVNQNGGASFDYSKYVNTPILVNSLNEIRDLYSDDWTSYSLCEAIAAHFDNGNEVVSPIILINMLDPDTHVAAEATSATVTLLSEGGNKVGYIEDAQCVLDDITITVEPALTAGEYTIEYEGDRVKLTITKADFSQSSVQVSYKKVDVSDTKISTTVFESALDALDHCEMVTGYIPNIVAAPKFSEDPTYHQLMVNKVASKISEKWYMISVSDIPCDTNADTVDEAITWKATNGYTNKFDKVCYPKVKLDGKVYHLSTITAFAMQRTDLENDNVPYVSPSNKAINADGAVLDDGSSIYISESNANKLNAVGITTVNIIKRGLRLWGSHMANYNFANLETIANEDRGDANIRMMLYLMNYLQYNYIDEIDTAFTRKDIDNVKTSVQQWLNSLVNEGKLLYATIDFNESENSTSNVVNGDFVFNVGSTLIPNAKSLTFKVNYTAEGLTLVTDGGEA